MTELQDILSRMDVPPMRRSDIHWLMRNLAVRNSAHPEFARAAELLKTLRRCP